MIGSQPNVLITGATGNHGRSLAAELECDYQIVGLDRGAGDASFPVLEADFAQDAGVELAMTRFRERFGTRIASAVAVGSDQLCERLALVGTGAAGDARCLAEFNRSGRPRSCEMSPRRTARCESPEVKA